MWAAASTVGNVLTSEYKLNLMAPGTGDQLRAEDRVPKASGRNLVCMADVYAIHQVPSVASPIICRSALAIEAHRGVASLANTARYGLRDAPCAALRWLRAAYDI
ncbi:hypothetical protein [Verminephrobacter eiseniae]|uniref:Uncharacterized protein n=1 Tax=Verminephrobacter eiseniae (strain EF01-2) TaxID=391735 RepID=A1WES4_VEREI|nr:hypothetical protein [Verminephrobacter eiseniae]ABM56131.1 hypothetical protein Veis_0341 [Verminephrobacter eiseniae EF01-2]